MCENEEGTHPNSSTADEVALVSSQRPALIRTVRSEPHKPEPNLLALPGEARNSIYEYAITEENGLQYTTSSSEIPEHITKEVPDMGACFVAKPSPSLAPYNFCLANPLSFTNRQLRHETMHLEYRYNDIEFVNRNPHSIEVFAEFLARHAEDASVLSKLRTITLHSTPTKPNVSAEVLVSAPCSLLAVNEVLEFCSANPHVTVRWRRPDWHYNDPMFIIQAVLITLAVRNNTEFLSKVSKGEAVIEAMILDGFQTKDRIPLREVLDHPGRQIWPENFRFMPEPSAFDEAAFRETQSRAKRFERFRLPGAEGIEHWVALAKEIFEKGV
jgi:hypothetical protein